MKYIELDLTIEQDNSYHFLLPRERDETLSGLNITTLKP